MLLWSLARASALVAYGAYTLVVTWGILVAARAFRPAAPAVALHRFLALVGLAGVATHIAALLLDSYAKVHLPALVGIGSSPGAKVGAIALWLIIALPLSFRLRKAKIISQRAWRNLHWFGYAAWASMLVHGIASGTDTSSPWAAALYAGSAGLVASAITWKALRPTTTPSLARR
jgi:hypothetical protein